MSGTSVQGQNIPQSLRMEDARKRAGREQMTGQQMMKKTIRLINSAAGAPLNQNFIDTANLDSLMLAIMSERAELLEEVLREQVQEVRTKNDKLKKANSIMSKARAAKKGSKEEEPTDMPKDVIQFFHKNSVPWGKGGGKIDPNKKEHKLNSGEWDLAIENIKSWTESLTSSSQLDMTKLQSTSGKFNQTFEMMSQFISKYYRSGDNIIKNI